MLAHDQIHELVESGGYLIAFGLTTLGFAAGWASRSYRRRRSEG